MRIRVLLLAGMILAIASNTSCCNEDVVEDKRGQQNNDLAFIPGDACFPFLLSEKWVQSIKPGSTELRYRHPPLPNTIFAPFEGYELCSIDFSAAFCENLKTGYKSLRDKWRRKITYAHTDSNDSNQPEELNPCMGFIYPADAPIRPAELGWRCNESLAIQLLPIIKHHEVASMTNGPFFRYTSFATTRMQRDAEIMLSARVPPLRVKETSLVLLGSDNGFVHTIHPEGNFKLVVAPHNELMSIHRQEDGAIVIVISEDSFVVYLCSDRRWVKQQL